MSKILSSIACNLDTHILQAAIPLFAAEKIQAIEWSFDTLYKHRKIPTWFIDLLKAFSNENRLIGHGVYFSLFSGKWTDEQQQWLDHLEAKSKPFNFDHITEHFGFMTGEDFHKGAPVPIPFNKTTLSIGIDRLKRIYNACQCPVGLENLAFAYSLEEVKKHGAFLNELIEPVNGFIILDLHNLYCQLHNFAVDFEDIIQLYPLQRVREIHISGGSWETSSLLKERKIRRDTHDDAVPEEVFQLLKRAIDLCPNLKYVVLEQLGLGLKTEKSRQQFQEDFIRMDHIVCVKNETLPEKTFANFLPENNFKLKGPIESKELHEQQVELSNILENAENTTRAQQQLSTSSLAQTDWDVENWEPYMFETVIQIAQKWKDGFKTTSN